MLKTIVISAFLVVVASPAFAQEVVMICYQNPGQNPVCQPVSTANPLPVSPQ